MGGARMAGGGEQLSEEDEGRAIRLLKEAFNLLSPFEQRLFLSLSVFSGSFTRDMGWT